MTTTDEMWNEGELRRRLLARHRAKEQARHQLEHLTVYHCPPIDPAEELDAYIEDVEREICEQEAFEEYDGWYRDFHEGDYD